MKKLLCAVVIVLVLSVPVQSFAVDFSTLDLFSAMSVNDLLRAQNILSEELMNRGYSEHTLNKGKYTVGEEIKPGVYMLSTPHLMHSALFTVRSEDGEPITVRSVSYDWRYHEFCEKQGQTQIELTEGQILELFGPITFYQYRN